MPVKDNSINRRIANFRSLAGYTQESAALALGLNKNTYARMERSGSPKPDLLKKIAELYNVTTDEILYGKSIITTENNENVVSLHDKKTEFKSCPPLMLTTNEKNCIKLCRMLSNKDKNELVDYIKKFVKDRIN